MDNNNWGIIKANWKQFTGKVKETWGDLTDDEIAQIEGNRDQLIGKIQEKYHMSIKEAEAAVDRFSNKVSTY